MGIRPEMMTIFGIDNWKGQLDSELLEKTTLELQDSDYPDRYERAFLKDMFYYPQKRWQTVDEVLYHGDRDWSVPDILGMILHRGPYDDDLVRVLCTFHEEYMQSGKQDIPVWDPKDNSLYAREIRTRTPKCVDIEWQWSWFYPSVLEQHFMWPVQAFCTRYVLERAGLQIPYQRYKAMLVWEWS